MQPNISTNDKCMSNCIPPTWKASMMSLRPEKKPNHISHTTMTDDPASVGINAKSPGHSIIVTRSRQAVCRSIRLGIDT